MSPYGIKGETPEQTKWMESCVDSVMKTGKDKGAAIAICKVQLQKRGKKKARSEELPDEKSLQDSMRTIDDALRSLFATTDTEPVSARPYLVDVFETYCIVDYAGKLFKLDYNISDNESVIFSNPVEVERKVIYEVRRVESSKNTKRITYGNIMS